MNQTRMPLADVPLLRQLGHSHGPVKNHSLYPDVFRALLDQPRIDFLEEPGHGSGNRGMDFEEGLGDGIDGLDVGQRGASKDVDVIQGAAVDVG